MQSAEETRPYNQPDLEIPPTPRKLAAFVSGTDGATESDEAFADRNFNYIPIGTLLKQNTLDAFLNWVKGKEVGDTVWVRPYDVDHGGIRRFFFPSSKMTEENSKALFAPLYTWYSATGDGSDVAGIKINYQIGLINAGAKADETGAGGTNYATAVLGVDGLTDKDFIIVNRIDNYGRGKTDDIFIEAASEEEAIQQYNAKNWAPASGLSVIKGTETFTMNRIDAALARVRTYVSKGGSDGIYNVTKENIVSDHNAPIYNLNGVQVNPNTLKKGIYIKQGKKFIVK